MSDWDRYGSPYDPNYRGKNKIKRPPSQSELEQHRLRGCADPNCAWCNPETANRASSPASAPRVSEVAIEVDLGRLSGSFMEGVLRGMFGAQGGIIEGQGAGESGASGGEERQPPASYLAARQAVQGYIVTAPDQSFDDIVGNEEALEQLRDAIRAPVVQKELYAAYGMKMPKGALLSGPPGCGKTMFARAAASEMRRLYGEATEFISISGSELQSMYVGETEGRIKALFTYAREYQAFHGHPLLIFMDEAEVLLPDRTGRVRRVAPWEESRVATFLAEMDGIRESGAFVLLATNRPEVIDQAVLRDGRCDFKIAVKRPSAAAIESILRKNFAGVLLGGDDIDALVFAAVEALYDPHKIIAEAQTIGINRSDRQVKDFGRKHFLLEHILSGAIAASVPGRAKRAAFARDKADGIARGVQVADVLRAVNDIFEENRSLDHSFALAEFRKIVLAEAQAAIEKAGDGGQ